MKGFALLLMLAVAGVASAGTVTLEQSPCDQASFCMNVANDAGESLTIIYSKQYGRLVVLDGSKTWDSGLWALVGTGDVLVSVPLYDGLGNVLYATATFAGGQVTGKCRQSGRVCVFPHAPRYIASGTLVN